MDGPRQINPRFVGEQVGPHERTLKEKLAAAFLNDGMVGRAYLAQADLGDGSGLNVVLGLVAPGCDQRKILDEIDRIFASIFHAKAHLDIMFLSESSHSDIQKVCRPFFERGRHTSVQIH
jgi:hypothetical protein